jgi:NADPH-dependent curcumin reductase CurA
MARAWHLERRPEGMPVREDFAMRDLDLPALADGQVRVRNHWLSVDPYMRGRMNDVQSYAAPFALGEPMTGGAVGEVLESRDHALKPGDLVVHMAGWRDEAVIGAKEAQKLPDLSAPEQAFLGQLGMPGMTAYFGLLHVAEAKPGETVFVSAAAGAVGSTVVQIAKAKGMTVIGSAGGAAKCDWVHSLGADHVIDYKSGESIVRQLNAAAPGGIDVYFDNVGADHLDAAFATARENARFAICGMIDIYNSGAPTQLRYIARTIAARIRIQGFLVSDWLRHVPDFYRDMGGLLAEGKLQRQETVVEGLQRMPEAFLGLFEGANTGKMLVKV